MRRRGDDRNRALLLALTATFIALVISKIVFGLLWYAAFLFAVIVFGIAFALFLRIQRNTLQ